jgi:DNA polymerase-3 subunit delta'
MSLDNIPGQGGAKALATAWLRTQRVPHSILIKGPAGSSKRTLAMEIAKAVNCAEPVDAACDTCPSCRKIENLVHPDVHALMPLVSGSKKTGDATQQMRSEVMGYLRDHTNLAVSNVNIAREHLLNMRREIYFAPTEGNRKIGIVFEADRMHPAGSNSLLKTLEEPPSRALLILVSTFPERLLPTIRSRCQNMVTRSLSRLELEEHLQPMRLAPDRFELTVRLADGNLHRAKDVATGSIDATRTRVESFLLSGCKKEDNEFWRLTAEIGGKAAREDLEQFLEICAQYLRDIFLIRNGREHRARHIDRSEFLHRINTCLTPEMLEAIAEEVDQAFLNITQNVAPTLALVDLWRRLGNGDASTCVPGPVP